MESKSIGSVKQSTLSLVEEFKQFAVRGNMIDLAVAVVIGTAFAKIVDSLVKAIIMPLVSIVLPAEQSYLNWSLKIGEIQVPYGLFIGEIVNFLIVALALFIFIVKFLGWLTKTKKTETAPAPPAPTKEEMLLTEIRDLLKAKA